MIITVVGLFWFLIIAALVLLISFVLFLVIYRSTRKKLFLALSLTAIVLFGAMAIGLVAVKPFERDKGPYDFPDSVWVSESPQIELHVSHDHVIEHSEAFLIVDGERIDVDIALEANSYPVRISVKGENSLEAVLIEGTLSSVKEGEISFEVERDRVYGGAYRTITLRRVDG